MFCMLIHLIIIENDKKVLIYALYQPSAQIFVGNNGLKFDC